MLESIYKGIKSIVKFFEAIVDFVIDFFEDLVYVIELVGETVKDIPSYLDFFPPVIVTGVLALVGVAVVFKILGRE